MKKFSSFALALLAPFALFAHQGPHQTQVCTLFEHVIEAHQVMYTLLSVMAVFFTYKILLVLTKKAG